MVDSDRSAIDGNSVWTDCFLTNSLLSCFLQPRKPSFVSCSPKVANANLVSGLSSGGPSLTRPIQGSPTLRMTTPNSGPKLSSPPSPSLSLRGYLIGLDASLCMVHGTWLVEIGYRDKVNRGRRRARGLAFWFSTLPAMPPVRRLLCRSMRNSENCITKGLLLQDTITYL